MFLLCCRCCDMLSEQWWMRPYLYHRTKGRISLRVQIWLYTTYWWTLLFRYFTLTLSFYVRIFLKMCILTFYIWSIWYTVLPFSYINYHLNTVTLEMSINVWKYWILAVFLQISTNVALITAVVGVVLVSTLRVLSDVQVVHLGTLWDRVEGCAKVSTTL